MISLIYAPNKIFQQIAKPVTEITDEIKNIIDEMFEILRTERGFGLGANMVGILQNHCHK
jgi:peptide deformylase